MDDHSQPSAHLVGACGAGMKALAEVLLDADWSLSGSDLLPASAGAQTLIRRGMVIHQGHSKENLPPSTDRLIYSPAIPANNSERIEAARRHLPQFSYGQMIGQLMAASTGVCIAGTHGKSTTTAMTACILDRARRLSAVVMGAELCDGGRSGWSGSGDLFVAESCEFQQSFLDFKPKYTAILSIEPDHFDCYPSLDSLTSAFCDFAGGTSADGVLLVNNDCDVSATVSSQVSIQSKRVSFGSKTTADWMAVDCRPTTSGSRFGLSHQGKSITDVELGLFGRHNMMNALAAAALCCEIGIAPEIVREALARFRGIRRRFEFVGEWNGVTFFDDYAHHPTAVKVTLETLRQVVGNRRIRCVFQPHQVRRTVELMDEFAASFSAADEVLLAPVFAARESTGEQPVLVSRELAGRISSNGVAARAFASLDQIVSTLDDASCPGDVIVTMGAGDIDRIHHEFIRRVQSDSSAG